MFRMARRDMRANRLRTVLTVLLIALPVLVVSAGMTLLATADVNAVESIPRELGKAEASIALAGDIGSSSNRTAIKQRLGGMGAEDTTVAAKPLPGLVPGQQTLTTSVVQRLTGGTVIAHSTQGVRVVLGDRRVRGTVTGLDGRSPVAEGIATLASGRWPTTHDEVLVSKQGANFGIPTAGALVLDLDSGKQRTVRVVGTVTTHDRAALVALPDAALTDRYLVGRSSAVLAAEIGRLNAYGLAVDSRYYRENPVADDVSSGSGNSQIVTLLIATGVVIMTVLLAGPALTVSGPRHRRALAQLASNGSTAPMLRKYVFGQALLLGAISSIVGVTAGCLLGLLGARVILWFRPTTNVGPTDVPVMYAAGLAAVAALACLGAALVPAAQAASTNVVAALRGQVSPRRARRGLPAVGLAVAVVGGAVIFGAAIKVGSGELGMSFGAVLLFLGATMCLPALLAVVGRLAGKLPVAGRVGVRDVARQRGRSASAVGATMAVVALTTALAVGGTSDLTQQRNEYLPQALMGEGTIQGSPSELGITQRSLAAQVPDAVVARVSEPAGSPLTNAFAAGAGSSPATVVMALPPGCAATAATAKLPLQPMGGRCASVSNLNGPGIVVADTALLSRVLTLTAAQRGLLDRSGVLVVSPAKTADGAQMLKDPVRGGSVRIGIVDGAVVQDNLNAASSRTVTVPAASLRVDSARVAELVGGAEGVAVAVVSPQGARRLGLQTVAARLIVTQPGGVTRSTERDISDRLPGNAYLAVERGYDPSGIRIIWIMMAVMGALLLIVTVIGTALVQGESAPDQATLGALGAPGGLRRRIAAAQALALGLTGSVVGLVIGLVPGIAITWPLTNVSYSGDGSGALPGPTIDIPWLALTAVVIGVPLLSALAAVVFQRRTPSLTARTI